MITRALWLPDVLRDANLKVVEHDGWKSRGHGDFLDLRAVVWHHDASAVGDSPGVPAYMLRNWNRAGAQLWVSRQGVWHVLASGVAYHAGNVLAGKPSNRYSLGVETDHTTGEDWPAELLYSLRIGTAAILHRLDVPAQSGLEFHRTICAPKGRKSDPDGLHLDLERALVGQIRSTRWTGRKPSPAITLTALEEDTVLVVIDDTADRAWLVSPWRRQKRRIYGAELTALGRKLPLIRGKDYDARSWAAYKEVK